MWCILNRQWVQNKYSRPVTAAVNHLDTVHRQLWLNLELTGKYDIPIPAFLCGELWVSGPHGLHLYVRIVGFSLLIYRHDNHLKRQYYSLMTWIARL